MRCHRRRRLLLLLLLRSFEVYGFGSRDPNRLMIECVVCWCRSVCVCIVVRRRRWKNVSSHVVRTRHGTEQKEEEATFGGPGGGRTRRLLL